MIKKIISTISMSVLLLLPTITFAAPFDAGARPVPNLNAGTPWLLNIITGIIGLLWVLFIAFAVIMFIVAGFFFLKAQGEPAELVTARKALLWGMIGVVVGIIAFLLPFIIRAWIV